MYIVLKLYFYQGSGSSPTIDNYLLQANDAARESVAETSAYPDENLLGLENIAAKIIFIMWIIISWAKIANNNASKVWYRNL